MRPSQQVAEVLPHADAQQPVERGERDDHRLAGRVARGSRRCRDVAARQLGHAVRPAHQAERLDERCRRTEHDREHAQRGRRGEGHGQHGRQRQHRQRAQEQELPAKEEAGTAGGEAAQDLVRLPAQDVRVVERPSEREERPVERNRDHDQQDPGQRLNAHVTAFDA